MQRGVSECSCSGFTLLCQIIEKRKDTAGMGNISSKTIFIPCLKPAKPRIRLQWSRDITFPPQSGCHSHQDTELWFPWDALAHRGIPCSAQTKTKGRTGISLLKSKINTLKSIWQDSNFWQSSRCLSLMGKVQDLYRRVEISSHNPKKKLPIREIGICAQFCIIPPAWWSDTALRAGCVIPRAHSQVPCSADHCPESSPCSETLLTQPLCTELLWHRQLGVSLCLGNTCSGAYKSPATFAFSSDANSVIQLWEREINKIFSTIQRDPSYFLKQQTFLSKKPHIRAPQDVSELHFTSEAKCFLFTVLHVLLHCAAHEDQLSYRSPGILPYMWLSDFFKIYLWFND